VLACSFASVEVTAAVTVFSTTYKADADTFPSRAFTAKFPTIRYYIFLIRIIHFSLTGFSEVFDELFDEVY